MQRISSADNPGFRRWLRLAQRTRDRRAQHRSLAEGTHLARAALDAGTPIEAWLLRADAEARQGELADALARLRARDIPGYELAPALYERIAPVEHGAGLMLVVASRSDPLPRASSDDLVFLDGVQDPGNVGTLLRVAAAAGIRHVLGSAGCAEFWSPKALRAGMGAQFRLRTSEQVDPAALPAALDGAWIASDAHDAHSLWRHALPAGAIGWVFGAEGHGVSSAVMAICRDRITIPIASAVDSLNVAAAAAVCLFERRRLAETREDPSANIGESPNHGVRAE
jgi:TrmH family RNA methyltransferase